MTELNVSYITQADVISYTCISNNTVTEKKQGINKHNIV